MSAIVEPTDVRLPQQGLYRVERNGLELRSADSDAGMPTLFGHFAVYNRWTKISSRREGRFMERFAKGSLARTVQQQGGDMRVLFHHGLDPQVGIKVLGQIIRLEDTPVGVEYEVALFDTSYNRDLLPGLRSGAYGASFSFDVIAEEAVPAHRVRSSDWNPEGLTERTVLEARVVEFGPCILPAYPDATALCRSITDEILESRGRSSVLIHRGLPDTGAGAPVTRSPRRYDRIDAYVRDAVWAMEPKALLTITEILAERRAGYRPTEEEIRSRIGGERHRSARRSSVESESPVAVIPITGTIAPRQSMIDNSSSAGTSIETLQAQLQAALKDPNVSAILFDIESPGGSVDLVPELASEILAARGSKPIVAQANTFAASAAYWLAAACDEIIVSPSGQVGSIGVYAAHRDESGFQAQKGLKTTLVSAGAYKTEGNQYEPLSDEARAEMQAKVDAYYDMFTSAVADGRGVDQATVESDYGQGRMVMAAQAVKQGMADEVATFGETLARLEQEYGDSAAAVASIPVPAIPAPAAASATARTPRPGRSKPAPKPSLPHRRDHTLPSPNPAARRDYALPAPRRAAVEPARLVKSSTSPLVQITSRVFDQIRRQIAEYPGLECGGALIGARFQDARRLLVDGVEEAPGIATRSDITLDFRGVHKQIADMSDGKRRVRGMWHSHPAGNELLLSDADIDGATRAMMRRDLETWVELLGVRVDDNRSKCEWDVFVFSRTRAGSAVYQRARLVLA